MWVSFVCCPEILTDKIYDRTKKDILSLDISLPNSESRLPFDDENSNMKNIVYKIKNRIHSLPDNISQLIKDFTLFFLVHGSEFI